VTLDVAVMVIVFIPGDVEFQVDYQEVNGIVVS
jgi:hypothetical protein